MKYLIWSFEHRAWWAPARCGYTKERGSAGEYLEAEAIEICQNANAHSERLQEAMVPTQKEAQ